MTRRVYTNSKDQILDAAESILLASGPGKLSVDAVCAAAQLSKGGFFYHFKTKDDLLYGLLERLLGECDKDIETFVAEDPNPRGRRTRAYIRATFGIDEAKQRRQLALIRALMEVATSSPKILELAAAVSKDTFDRLRNDGISEALAQVLALATDGLMLAEAFGTSPLDKKEREALVRAMLQMSENTP